MQAHESVEQSESRIAEWQRFLDTAVHDLRAPLRGIGTSAELLMEACGERLDDPAKQLIGTILDGVAKMDALSKALASYSQALKIAGPPSGPIRVANALRSALAELEGEIRRSGATVDYGPLPRVRGSHEQLSALFRALLNNALLYHGTEPPSVQITAQREGDQWRFAVRDNGVGIDPKYWAQIFLPFQRLHVSTARAGVGLGLTICQKIVEAHGGTIWVDSQLQVGSTFFFTLPADGEGASGGES
jgi:light-regulated signal transduction histidine kinase (bacteriophytochrome)